MLFFYCYNIIKYYRNSHLISCDKPSSKMAPSDPSVQFSRSVVSDSLQPHELQHAQPPCPSPSPGVHSNSCPSSQWRHPTISSSVVPFSYRLQSFPTSGSLQMSPFFISGGQIIGVSASATTIYPSNKPNCWTTSSGWTSRIGLSCWLLPVQSIVGVFLFSPVLSTFHCSCSGREFYIHGLK